jgi:hypothetical protein
VDGLVSPAGGLDWYDGAIAKPVEVLTDMVGALAAPSSKVTPRKGMRLVILVAAALTDSAGYFRSLRSRRITVSPHDDLWLDESQTRLCPTRMKCRVHRAPF